MPNRILKETICTSETIEKLSPEVEVFFYRLLVQCDDYGRMDARPAIIRSRCYPLRLDQVSENHIIQWLKALIEAELIQIYTIDNKQYLQVTTWEKHQQVRAKRSKYPGPDSICNQLISDDSICPRNPNPNPNPNPNNNVSERECSDVAFDLSNQLKTLILRNNPKARVLKDLSSWAKEFDRMMQIDGRTREDIEAVIKFCQNDQFWHVNILSAGKLREKYDQLYLKMKSEVSKPTGSGPPKSRPQPQRVTARTEEYSMEEYYEGLK